MTGQNLPRTLQAKRTQQLLYVNEAPDDDGQATAQHAADAHDLAQ